MHSIESARASSSQGLRYYYSGALPLYESTVCLGRANSGANSDGREFAVGALAD
jgi:hypothetical protein